MDYLQDNSQKIDSDPLYALGLGTMAFIKGKIHGIGMIAVNANNTFCRVYSTFGKQHDDQDEMRYSCVYRRQMVIIPKMLYLS